jgi:hypothetical protein
VGLVLSALMIIPSIRSLPWSFFSVGYHLIMLGAVSSPFLILWTFRDQMSESISLRFVYLYGMCHLYLVYVSFANRPHEFGYVGLIFAPIFESVVVWPVAGLIVLVSRFRERTRGK